MIKGGSNKWWVLWIVDAWPQLIIGEFEACMHDINSGYPSGKRGRLSSRDALASTMVNGF